MIKFKTSLMREDINVSIKPQNIICMIEGKTQGSIILSSGGSVVIDSLEDFKKIYEQWVKLYNPL
jgi:hypothetical protein